ncbi:hypothetical protein PIB30_057935 [Stylosanthes scabra]|uniref:Uncharacterized protein n=1 Tax=Stylosanthes scabra TaxID=79078 RepID=A0ABU6UMU4_9FABA|nr:hypothetical protein [Stylosanthes scabra]
MSAGRIGPQRHSQQRHRVDEANVDLGGVQNGRPHPPIANPGGRKIPSAIDRIGSGGHSNNQEQHRSQTPRPFGGIGPNEFHIAQELRHHMQSMEQEVRELRKENAELRTAIQHLRSRGGDVITAARRRRNPTRKKIVKEIGGPFVDTRELEVGK